MGRSSLREDLRTVARGWRWSHRPLVPGDAEAWAQPRDRRDFPTEWARSRPGRWAREALQRFGLKPLVWSQVSPTVHGLDRLEGVQGPVIFASNHTSHLDAPLVLCSLPRERRERTATAAAADYFFDSWWRATSTALVFNAFPVDRGAGRISSTPGDLLADGWSLLIFPEGTRSHDGWAQRFRRGTAYLCVEHGVPAVPVAIRGAYHAMPRGRSWPRPGRSPVSVRFGRPIVPEEGERFPSFNQRLEHAVAALLDEDRSTWWEAMRRSAHGETPPASGPDRPRWRRVWEATRPLPEPGERRRAWRR